MQMFSNVGDALMFMYCIPVPNLQCVYATQPFPRDDEQKNSAETHWSSHTPRSGPEVRHKDGGVKKQFTVEVKKQDTLGRDE